MMKKITTVLMICGLFLISIPTSAQVFGLHRIAEDEPGPKGQFMIYGSFEYSRTTSPAGDKSFVGTSTNASVPVGVGYFINNNDVIGINYAYANSHLDGKTIFKQHEVGLWYSPSVSLGKYFALIAQVDAHYVFGSRLIAGTSGLSTDQHYNGYRLRAYPMLAIFLGHGWALKFKFAELSMLQTKPKHGHWTSTYVVGIAGSTFGVGISKNFDFSKKEQL